MNELNSEQRKIMNELDHKIKEYYKEHDEEEVKYEKVFKISVRHPDLWRRRRR